jgi:hypothetical protein
MPGYRSFTSAATSVRLTQYAPVYCRPTGAGFSGNGAPAPYLGPACCGRYCTSYPIMDNGYRNSGVYGSSFLPVNIFWAGSR